MLCTIPNMFIAVDEPKANERPINYVVIQITNEI